MRNTMVRVTEIRVGDKISYNNRLWTVRSVRRSTLRHQPRVNFRLDWVQGTANRPYRTSEETNFPLRFSANNLIVKITERSCAPCRDSDCDCIFDQVEG